MSNKKQLQQNNADLATALDNINGLPIADDVKHGLYIWARYRYTPPVVNRDMTMTITQTYAEIIISNPSFALPETDYMFFDGFVNSSGSAPKFYKEGDNLKFETKSGTVADVSSYSKGDCKIILKSSGNTSDNGVYSMICHEKTISDAKKDFIEYLVSDNPGKYPDDGVQDGYYYKKIHAENATEYGIFYNDVDSEGYPTDAKLVQSDIKDNFFQTSVGYAVMYSKLHKMEIITNAIGNNSFTYAFYKTKNPFKMKLKCSSIERMAFAYACKNNLVRGNIWINKKCIFISGEANTNPPFYGVSESLKIYCETPSKPSNWGYYWNHTGTGATLTTTWGVSESQFDAL